MTMCHLSKRGYGSLKELYELDTTEFLDLVEYEQMMMTIETYEHREQGRTK